MSDEQCRINGMGAQRELKLMTEIESLKSDIQFESEQRKIARDDATALGGMLYDVKAQNQVLKEALIKVKHNGCCMVFSESCPACSAHQALTLVAEMEKK